MFSSFGLSYMPFFIIVFAACLLTEGPAKALKQCIRTKQQ
jgi:hypothetical protein